MADPVFICGYQAPHGPASIWKEVASGKYYTLKKTSTGAAVYTSTDNGVTWTLTTTLNWTNGPLLSESQQALCVDYNDQAIVAVPSWVVNGANKDWTIKWKKKALGGAWNSIQSSPVMTDLAGYTNGPRHLIAIPCETSPNLIHFIMGIQEYSVIEGSPTWMSAFYSYTLNTSTNAWTNFTYLGGAASGGAVNTARIIGIQAARLTANSTYEWGGSIVFHDGTQDLIWVKSFGTKTTVTAGDFTHSGFESSATRWNLENLYGKGFALCSDPSESKLHFIYIADSDAGPKRFIHEVVTYGTSSTLITSVESTEEMYVIPTGAEGGASGLGLDSTGHLYALMQVHAPAGVDAISPQNVFGVTKKLLPAGSWSTIDVWENFENEDTIVGMGVFGALTPLNEANLALIVSFSETPEDESGDFTSPGAYFYRLPRTFDYTPWAPSPEIFLTGIDNPYEPPDSPPSPPGSPPGTSPPGSPPGSPPLPGSPPSAFEPLSCTGGFREVLKPIAISEDSDGWLGGVSSLNDALEQSDGDISYILGNVKDGILGLEFNPPELLPQIGEQALNLTMRVQGTVATVEATLQFLYVGTTNWQTITSDVFTLTGTYANYVMYGDLPYSYPIQSFRAKLKILTPDSPQVYLTEAAYVICGDFVFPLQSPPIATEPLLPSIQLPPTPGDGDVFIPGDISDEEGEFTSPPGPPAPPLPLGTEILRPNRDVLVRLFHPRPVYMRINEPVDRPTDDPIYAPLLQERYSEVSGELVETIKPHFEVALTDPRTLGPWEHIQVRFRAARSRPPLEVPATDLPEVECQTPALTECPDPILISPVGAEENGSWQRAPLQWAIDEAVDDPDGCHIHSVVTDPPGKACRIVMNTPPHWEGGFSKITLKARARARAAKEDVGSRFISGFSAEPNIFNKSTAAMPPGTVDYEIQWNPYTCDGDVQAWKVSEKEMRGTGVLKSNIDIHARFYLSSQVTSNILMEVSEDGENFYGSLEFDLKAFTSIVIHYRVLLNNDALTPLGNHPLGLVMQVEGPIILTPHELVVWPPKAAFIISVGQGAFQPVPLTSRVRLIARPTGNFSLSQQPAKKTVTLTDDWVDHNLTWEYIWNSDLIRDLRFELQAEALELSDDVANVDVDVLAAELEYYCPGLSPPVAPTPVFVRDVYIEPDEDISTSNWSPSPVWSRLLGDPNLQSSEFVSTDPTKPNGFMVGLKNPVLSRPVPVGYRREWKKIEVFVQADIEALGSTKALLDVSTNYGASIRTPELTETSYPYKLTWEYDPGLTTEQINRVKVAIRAVPTLVGKNLSEVKVRVVGAQVYAEDILLDRSSVTVSPPPPPVLTKIELPSEVEIFNCGSMGICGLSPRRKVATITVRNTGYEGSASLNLAITGNLDYRFQGENDQVLEEDEVKTIELYAHVGTTDDPYPDFDTDGVIQVTLVQGSSTTRKTTRWFYNGNV